MPQNQKLIRSIYNDFQERLGPLWKSDERFPSLDHGLGTDRFLGLLFALYMRPYSKLSNNFDLWKSIGIIFSAIRAQIVLFDHSFDAKELSEEDQTYLHVLGDHCINIAMEEAEKLGFASEFDAMFSASFSVIEASYLAMDTGNYSLKHITGKCEPIFILPELIFMLDDSFPHEEMNLFMQNYLSILQFADDFFDMEEDFFGPVNHNIFVAGLSREQFDFAISARRRMRPVLVSYLKRVLFASLNEKLKGIIGRLIFETSQQLERWMVSGSKSRLWGESVSLDNYSFPVSDWNTFVHFIKDKEEDLSDWESNYQFRAEILHSFSSKKVLSL